VSGQAGAGRRAPTQRQAGSHAEAKVSFDYGETRISAAHPARHMVERGEEVRILRRNDEAEAALLETLMAEGCERSGPEWAARPYRLPLEGLSERCGRLIEAGWQVQIESKALRTGGALSMRVDSGIDWFDIKGEMQFGTQVVGLPTLLDAARRGRRRVRLDDGSEGLLPADWLAQIEAATALGEPAEDGLRFRGNQAWLLDALLAGREVEFDQGFETLRDRLAGFDGVRPARQPRGLVGTLREYQREGLAWLRFLEQTGFGGCLADDMGLGKTVQVLAFLEGRRAGRKKCPPTLVVAPRSLMFNWAAEAARFTPKLRVLDYTGQGRKHHREVFDDYDVILTTYGTLRRDITDLKDVLFGVVVLDESQAIKNAASQSAKAVRLLRGDLRIALSGTPIENHVGELWSLFEFLNPGMLGRARAFKEFAGGSSGRSLDAEARARLAAAIAPFILRRTKDQVLPDLPARTDQVLHCEMKTGQRRDYNRIRDHFRSMLLAKADETGTLGKMKIHVLEALLRLRQAACHPGLLDAERSGEGSAKLDALLPMLEEVAEGGHKALVFSQFTTFLSVVRTHLRKRNIAHEYLDGKTRDRQARVEAFQEDPDCRVFLISLKAGGLGLNLTAADYVFILDPWWNPAVERQAVDRAHRMGQTRPVMAYRLICTDTVEEKVLALQAEKQELADALLATDPSLLKTLTREDLELLLS